MTGHIMLMMSAVLFCRYLIFHMMVVVVIILDRRNLSVKLNAEVSPVEDDHHHHHHMEDEIATEQNGGHHQHDVTRHGQNIRSFTLVLDQPVKIDTFATALEALLFTQASRLLRIKGIVNTADRPGKLPRSISSIDNAFYAKQSRRLGKQ